MPVRPSSRARAFVSPIIRWGLRRRDRVELQGVSLDLTDETWKASLRNRVLSGGAHAILRTSDMNNRKSSHL